MTVLISLKSTLIGGTKLFGGIMPRQRKTTVFNMKIVAGGFINHRGEYLGNITTTGNMETGKRLAFHAVRYIKNKPQTPVMFLDYSMAKQYLIDGTISSI